MEVVLLGTGSADGWPNPFCGCASCHLAATTGEIRGQSAALLDNRLLLDCGPETPRAAVRLGRQLRDVRTLLLTHAHPDHLGPAALLWRAWARPSTVLDVVGPPEAMAACRQWLDPADLVSPNSATGGVRLRPVSAGQTLTLDRYRCTALAAAHEVTALLWDVEDLAGGGRLLYATDTGPLPEPTLAAMAGRRYDLVLLEETFGDRTGHGTGHLDLVTFPEQLAALRRVGAVARHTQVVATHLGHHNPPPAELTRRLAAWGAAPGRDGAVLAVGRDSQAAEPARGHRTLLLGGARSGKSVEAERRLAAEPEVVYAATAGPRPDDPEWRARVTAHRARRPTGWTTVESPDLVQLLGESGPPLLVDCLALWLTNRLDAAGAWEPESWPDAERQLRQELAQLDVAWRSTPRRVVAVSNEVGSGVVPATWSGRLFRDELGRLNARLAAASERVDLVVAGMVMRLQG